MTVLNVVDDYGAAGDGSTDDTSAIQSAIDDATAGDTVYLPGSGDTANPREYLVSRSASVDNTGALYFNPSRGIDDVTFAGDGADTKLKLDAPVSNFVQVITVETDSTVTGLLFKQFVADFRYTAQNSDVRGQTILIDDNGGANDNDITLRNVKAVNGYDSCIGAKAGGTTVERCTADNAARHSMTSGSDVGGSDNVFRDTLAKNGGQEFGTTYCLDFGTGPGLVEDCVFRNSAGSGFKTTERTTNVTFRRVRSEDNGGNGYQHTGGADNNPTVTMENVAARNNPGGNAFRLVDAEYIVPTDTEMVGYNSGNIGFRCDGGSLDSNGVMHADSNDSDSLYNSGMTGTIDDLQATGDVVRDSLTISSQGSSPKTDLSNVPIESEVGAFSGDSDGGGTGNPASYLPTTGGVYTTTAAGMYGTSAAAKLITLDDFEEYTDGYNLEVSTR